MTTTIKEAAIAGRYTSKWNISQAYLDLGANTKITVSVTPPSGNAYIQYLARVGIQANSANLTADVLVDGTRFFFVNAAGAVNDRDWSDDAPLIIVKNRIDLIINNGDSIAHTIDFILSGFIIQLNDIDAFLAEIRGDTDREIQKQILAKLDKLDKSIEKLYTTLTTS